MSKTDSEKGRIDGFCGLEPRYPNNGNYMTGFDMGHRQLMRDIIRDAPLDDFKPSGTDDRHVDCFCC